MKKLFLIFTFLFLAGAIEAASPVLLNDSPITVGANIALKVPSQNFSLNLLDAQTLPNIPLGNFYFRNAMVTEDGNLILILTAFRTGELTLPSLSIPFTDGSTLNTAPLNIEITSVLDPYNPPHDILDIKPIIMFARGITRDLILIAIVLLIVALAFTAYRLWRKRKLAKLSLPPEFSMPPKDFALQELENLKNSGLLEQKLVNEYYDKLSDIVRYYVSRVTEADCLEKTTSEIYAALRSTLSHADNTMLRSFLQTCDFAKFAKFVPSEKDAQEHFETAKSLVEKL